jgi:hypothetical protein
MIISQLFKKQNILAFSSRFVPLSATIFYGEPRHKRISASIGARLELFCFHNHLNKRNPADFKKTVGFTMCNYLSQNFKIWLRFKKPVKSDFQSLH